MKTKRIFKTLPTLLAIIGLLSVALLIAVIGVMGVTNDFKILAIFGMLTLVFFISEVGLQKKHLKELRLVTAKKKPFATAG